MGIVRLNLSRFGSVGSFVTHQPRLEALETHRTHQAMIDYHKQLDQGKCQGPGSAQQRQRTKANTELAPRVFAG